MAARLYGQESDRLKKKREKSAGEQSVWGWKEEKKENIRRYNANTYYFYGASIEK